MLPPKRLVVLIGLSLAFGLSIFFSFTIGHIYANGGTATIDLTAYGEQHIEFVIMWATIPLITLAGHYAIEWADETGFWTSSD